MALDNPFSIVRADLLPESAAVAIDSSASRDLVSTLTGSPHLFLQPPQSLHGATLHLAKEFLDPLALAVSLSQRQKQQQARLKRKLGENVSEAHSKVLTLSKLHLDGFDVDQVWGQAQIVLTAAEKELARERSLLVDRLSENGDVAPTTKRVRRSLDAGDSSNAPTVHPKQKTVSFNVEDGVSCSSDDGHSSRDADDDEELLSEDGHSLSPDEEQELDGGEEDEDATDDDIDDIDGLDDPAEPDGDITGGNEDGVHRLVEDKFGLNDGFFSIDEFNKQALAFERLDAAADAVGLNAEDEEDEIEWGVDPLQTAASNDGEFKARSRVNKHQDDELDDLKTHGTDEEEDDDEDKDGPTFGNVDLDMEDDEEDTVEADGSIAARQTAAVPEDANDIRYDDFFMPPARKGKRQDTMSKHPKSAMSKASKKHGTHTDTIEDNVQRTIDAVRRDLFDDDDDDDDDDEIPQWDEAEEQVSGARASEAKARLSTNERRQAKLAEEIRRLEAANVAKKEWALSGEARAADRPSNSLLQEDLDFERTGKPLPVITAEVTESIEEMIKRRILSQEFDELTRRRPDELLAATATRRGRFELDDNKAQRSLAQIYEEEHMRHADPEAHVDRRSEQQKEEHAEIEALWANICADLDGLSNWHYRPKPPRPAINIVTDVPTIAMEDARPTAAVGGDGNLARTSMLAPQEIYTPGKGRSSSGGAAAGGEVIPKSGLPVATEELTRDQKARRRRRVKERLRKQSGTAAGAAASTSHAEADKTKKKRTGGKATEQQAIVDQLAKGGVKIIGRRGEITDTKGRPVVGEKSNRGVRTAGALKL